jgi:hypothetical protein
MQRAISDTLALFDSRIEFVIPQPFSPAARPRLRPDMGAVPSYKYLILQRPQQLPTQPWGHGGFGGQTAPGPTACRLCNQLEKKAGDCEAKPFSLCGLPTLRGHEAEELRLWPRETNWGAHARRSVHLQFHEIPPPPHQLPACDKRQS